MRARAAALLLAVTALAAPATGTSAAWTDEARTASPTGASALALPAPALSCALEGPEVVVSWPAASLPGAGMPGVAYGARIVETGQVLAISGTARRSVRLGLVVLGGLTLGEKRTLEVTASAVFPSTTWTATSQQQVQVSPLNGVPGLTCLL